MATGQRLQIGLMKQKGLTLTRVKQDTSSDSSLSETEEASAPQGSNLTRSNEREADTYHDDKRMGSYMTSEFMQKFDKVYAHIVAKETEEELQKGQSETLPIVKACQGRQW